MADTFIGVGVGGVSSVPAQAIANVAISASEIVSVINRIFFTLAFLSFPNFTASPYYLSRG
jgi:hypothetical protein